jgi:hypothetical protein
VQGSWVIWYGDELFLVLYEIDGVVVGMMKVDLETSGMVGRMVRGMKVKVMIGDVEEFGFLGEEETVFVKVEDKFEGGVVEDGKNDLKINFKQNYKFMHKMFLNKEVI